MPSYELQAADPSNIEFRLTMKMTLREWEKVRDSLCEPKHYGPNAVVAKAIDEMVRQACASFKPFATKED